MQSVTEASDCSFRRYEGLRLRSLKQQVTSAKENWGGEMEDNDRDLGVSVYEKANALLENIEKAKSEIWKVKGKEFENTLEPVVMQCHDILRHIAYFQLPPVYPRILELTDAGPGVGVSSAECRWRLLEKARIHNSDKVLGIHRARQDSGQNEAERLNACIGDALCDGGSLKWQIYKPLHGLSVDEISSPTNSELETQRKANMEKNAWAVAEEVVRRVDDAPAPRGYTSTMMVDQPEEMIFYNRDFMKQYHDAPNNKKNTIPGHGYFAKLASFEEEHCEKGELYMEYRKMSCQEKNGELCEYCRATDFLSPTSATPTPRPYPDYSKLPDFHYLPGTKTPTTGRKPDDYQPRAQIKQMFQEGTLKAGDKNAIKDFSEKYIVSEKLVADYIDHLTDIELRKDKRRTENDRKRTARKQQEYNDIDWQDLYHKNQLSTLRVGELELYINNHNILFKGKKDEKVRVVKAHIGSKILTSIVQEKQTNIPLASDSNPESDSDSDSDRVEGIVGSSSNSSELNDSGDQAADRQQLEQETIPESSTSRYGRKRTRVLRENYVPWNNIHVDTQ